MEFKQQVATSCGVDPSVQQFKTGFPPQRLEMLGQRVSDLGLSHGETLTLEKGQGSTVAVQPHGMSSGDMGAKDASIAAGQLFDGR